VNSKKLCYIFMFVSDNYDTLKAMKDGKGEKRFTYPKRRSLGPTSVPFKEFKILPSQPTTEPVVKADKVKNSSIFPDMQNFTTFHCVSKKNPSS